jgi:hypothetical protein
MLALLAFFAVLRVVAMLSGTSDGRPTRLAADHED